MHKKRILIVNKSLKMGGVQRALINMLNELSDHYDITVFFFYDDGELKNHLPKNVHRIKSNFLLKSIGMTMEQARSSGNFLIYFFRLFAAVWSRLFSNWLPITLAIYHQRKLKGFDIAISYIQDSNSKSLYSGYNRFVLDRVEARMKIAWIHGDYLLSGLNTARNRALYKRFDKVVSVSKGCMDKFLEANPDFIDKACYVYNIYPINEIRRLSATNEHVIPRENVLRFVTVARLGWEKGFVRAIEVMSRLKTDGYRFKWYIVGDGIEKETIAETIKRENIQNEIVLIGHKDNPYPYMKQADIFLLPSMHEAAPMSIGEAMICGTPVIATDYASANEQIKDGIDGLIAENSFEGLYSILKMILDNPSLLEKFREHIFQNEYNNELSLEQHHKCLAFNK